MNSLLILSPITANVDESCKLCKSWAYVYIVSVRHCLPTYPSQKTAAANQMLALLRDRNERLLTYLMESLTKYCNSLAVNRSILSELHEWRTYFTVIQHVSSICYWMNKIDVCPCLVVGQDQCVFLVGDLVSRKGDMRLFATLYRDLFVSAELVKHMASLSYLKHILHHFPYSAY